MATDIAAHVSLEALASELGVASPQKSLVTEGSSSPPPLIDNNSGITEDVEIGEKQDAIGLLQGELQLSHIECSALQDRYKRLERQHGELQDLASAYSDIIGGFSPTDCQTASIDQLLAEAGHDGFRAKALEADVLRPLVREAGGLQALISQLNTTRRLIEKAGGPRELEQFVSDLRTIRDTLDEVRGSRGLAGLAAEVRDLFQSKQKHDGLAFEVDRPTGLRSKAAKYDKLAQAFVNLQDTSTLQRTSAFNAAMNPDRARMISATPLEADPDRDLYEAPPPVAKPNNRTGSNNTPLGAAQEKPPNSSLKRKDLVDISSGVPAKRPRVDVARASALLQMSLPATTSSCADQIAGPENLSDNWTGTAAVKARTQPASVHVADSLQGQSNKTNKRGKTLSLKAQPGVSRAESESAKTDMVSSGFRVQNTPPPPEMPDWMRSDVRFGDLDFASATGGPGCTSMTLAQNAERHTDAILEPGSFSMAVSSLPACSSQTSGNADGAQTALQAMAAVPADPRLSPITIRNDHFWVGVSGASAPWNLLDLKKSFHVPAVLRTYLTGELSKLVPIAKYSTYETMAPNRGTCILGYLIDGHGPSDLPRERTACRLCTQHRRPCALLQEICGSRMVVFVPLRAELRPGVRWFDKAFWIQDLQKSA